jgi:hypothetical protein
MLSASNPHSLVAVVKRWLCWMQCAQKLLVSTFDGVQSDSWFRARKLVEGSKVSDGNSCASAVRG